MIKLKHRLQQRDYEPFGSGDIYTTHKQTLDTSKVTRVEVIDENGRSYTKYGVEVVEFSLQDDNKTLKLFLSVNSN